MLTVGGAPRPVPLPLPPPPCGCPGPEPAEGFADGGPEGDAEALAEGPAELGLGEGRGVAEAESSGAGPRSPCGVLDPVRGAPAVLPPRADEVGGDDGGGDEERGDPGGGDEHPRTPGEPGPPGARPRPSATGQNSRLGRLVGLGDFDAFGNNTRHRRRRRGRGRGRGRNGSGGRGRGGDRLSRPRCRPHRRPPPRRVRHDPPPVHLHQLVARRPAHPREPLHRSELVRHGVPVAVPVERRRADVQLPRQHTVAAPRTVLQILQQSRELHGLRRRHDGVPLPRASRNGVPGTRNSRRSPYA